MPRREGSCRAGSRSSRSTPRRRSWSGTSGIMGGNGSRRASQTRCASTIFRATRAGRLFRTASTTWPATRPGSAWDAITTRPPSQLPRFVSGGPRWAGAPTPRRPRCSSRADAGSSNGYRSRAWKRELQTFADETQLRVRVSHPPPGTSKWNKIEHRLFCHITENWRGTPLTTFETIVDLIGNTRRRPRPCGSRRSLTRARTPRASRSPHRKWTHSPLYPTRSMGSGTTNCDPAEVGESKSIKVLSSRRAADPKVRLTGYVSTAPAPAASTSQQDEGPWDPWPDPGTALISFLSRRDFARM